MIFELTWENNVQHSILKKQKKLKGNERFKLGLELCHTGCSELKSHNIIFNKGILVLRKIIIKNN